MTTELYWLLGLVVVGFLARYILKTHWPEIYDKIVHPTPTIDDDEFFS